MGALFQSFPIYSLGLQFYNFEFYATLFRLDFVEKTFMRNTIKAQLKEKKNAIDGSN